MNLRYDFSQLPIGHLQPDNPFPLTSSFLGEILVYFRPRTPDF